ncbi:Collagen alpha-1(III) chain like [Fagus crenata]
MASNPSLQPEIGPDGLPREAPVIAYTEKIIEEEQLQLKKYIEENYSKIRDVEREFANLSFEMKLTAGPKKAALEHLRKKIEMSTEKIRVAKLKEEQARKVWEAASQAVKDEEAIKQKLCEDLSQLVQESSHTQFSRLEELKRRLEALNPSRASTSVPLDGQSVGPPQNTTVTNASQTTEPVAGVTANVPNHGSGGNVPVMNGKNQQPSVEGEGREKKKIQFQGRGKGIGAVPKGRGSPAAGWTGAGFDVDGRT